jgi:hypothetical protein
MNRAEIRVELKMEQRDKRAIVIFGHPKSDITLTQILLNAH